MYAHTYRSTGSHKFDGDLITERLYDYTLFSGQDADLGDSDTFGWFALFGFGSDLEFRVFTGGAAGSILDVDSQGFVSRTDYATRTELDAEWERLESEYDAFMTCEDCGEYDEQCTCNLPDCFTYNPSDRFTVTEYPGVAFYVCGVNHESATVVMVGDDATHIVDPDDLTKIDSDAYCHGCGQLACTGDGR